MTTIIRRHEAHTSERSKSRLRGRVRPRPRLRILLAEDDYELRGALHALLETDGYDVHTVPHGAAMLDFLASWILYQDREPPVDLIITDVRMPGFNGLSILEGLRANGWTTPVIVISAFGDESMRARVQKLGSAAYFPKPFDPLALERAILQLTVASSA
jgi:DNA-binding response OmpR family regulator